MTRIKICGLTQPDDVAAALELGADFLGFIHVPKSPRFVARPRLRELLDQVDGRAGTAIVVQDAEPETLERLRSTLSFDNFQFHGSESAETVLKWKGFKVIHMRDQAPDLSVIKTFGSPFLLDTQTGARRGGTGETFDWSVLPSIPGNFFVAGGLGPENISDLIRAHHPWGVDVSSGIEAEPGRKDLQKMAQFVQNVRRLEAG